MNYLLDTCVLSEFTRRKPEQKMVHWVDIVSLKISSFSA